MLQEKFGVFSPPRLTWPRLGMVALVISASLMPVHADRFITTMTWPGQRTQCLADAPFTAITRRLPGDCRPQDSHPCMKSPKGKVRMVCSSRPDPKFITPNSAYYVALPLDDNGPGYVRAVYQRLDQCVHSSTGTGSAMYSCSKEHLTITVCADSTCTGGCSTRNTSRSERPDVICIGKGFHEDGVSPKTSFVSQIALSTPSSTAPRSFPPLVILLTLLIIAAAF